MGAHSSILPRVRDVVVYRNFHFLPLAKPLQHADQQLHVEGVRVVEVIFVESRQVVLFLVKYLKELRLPIHHSLWSYDKQHLRQLRKAHYGK